MKNDSTPIELGDARSDRSTLGDIEREIRSIPSEGWAEEIRKHFKIATIAASSVVNAQEGTATKAMLLESYENDLNRHIRYIERLLAKARQEVMMTELVHCEEAIERVRQEVYEEMECGWDICLTNAQYERCVEVQVKKARQEARQECAEKIKEALEVEKCCYTMHCGCLMENSGLRKNFDDLIKKLEEEK